MRLSKSVVVILLGALLLGIAAWLSKRTVWSSPQQALVVYCSHDAEYSEPLLKEFERRTGIPVLIRFDTEATKSLGLVNLLIHEKSQSRCDVFWNNELLGMLELQSQGVLEAYRGQGYERIPDRYKDPEGHWTGFAARLRVHIVNTSRLKPEPEAVDQLWRSGKLEQLAIAKPLYGTTLAHYAVLSQVWGLEHLQSWHRLTREQGLHEVNGNATVKNLVAQGACSAGLTDTDDFFVAKDAGLPVAMLPVRVGDNQTICIPNCVAIIRGTRHAAEARQLVDFLLSAETEFKLAQSRSRQIPLGTGDRSTLPAEVRELADWAQDGLDLRPLLSARRDCVAWLTREYLQVSPSDSADTPTRAPSP